LFGAARANSTGAAAQEIVGRACASPGGPRTGCTPAGCPARKAKSHAKAQTKRTTPKHIKKEVSPGTPLPPRPPADSRRSSRRLRRREHAGRRKPKAPYSCADGSEPIWQANGSEPVPEQGLRPDLRTAQSRSSNNSGPELRKDGQRAPGGAGRAATSAPTVHSRMRRRVLRPGFLSERRAPG